MLCLFDILLIGRLPNQHTPNHSAGSFLSLLVYFYPQTGFGSIEEEQEEPPAAFGDHPGPQQQVVPCISFHEMQGIVHVMDDIIFIMFTIFLLSLLFIVIIIYIMHYHNLFFSLDRIIGLPRVLLQLI